MGKPAMNKKGERGEGGWWWGRCTISPRKRVNCMPASLGSGVDKGSLSNKVTTENSRRISLGSRTKAKTPPISKEKLSTKHPRIMRMKVFVGCVVDVEGSM
jgi:hypothetical protein